MKRPPPLEAGMKVALLSSARSITSDELKPALELLSAWGLEAVIGQTINTWEDQFAGSDRVRAKDLQDMLDREDIRAIIFARGGYGTMRIIDRIDFTRFADKPKWLVGYSDITVLHSHVQRLLDIQSLHASMPVNFGTNTPGALNSLKTVLFGDLPKYIIDIHTLNRGGRANGVLCGGNLSVLYSISGSASDISTEGRILFIEELDEYLYHIDRMMLALRRAGKLSKLAGLIVGGMTDMKDNLIPYGKTAEEIIAEQVAEFDYPVCFNFPAGHVTNNQAIVMGAEVVLNVDDSGVSFDYV